MDDQRLARLKSNGKLYQIVQFPYSIIPISAEIRREMLARNKWFGFYAEESFKKSFIELKPLNPKTGKPWQASRRYSLDSVEVL